MKNRVITLLNYPKEFVKKSNLLYKFTVYTPQEEMKAIVQERPEIRLDTLRYIFGIDRYKQIKENAQIFLQKIKEECRIKEILASELNLIKEKSNLENEKRIVLTKELNDLNIEYQNIILAKDEAEEKLSSMQGLLDEKRNLESEFEKQQILIQSKKDMALRMKREMSLMQRQTQEKISFSQEKLDSVSALLMKHREILEDKNSKFLNSVSRVSVLESKKERPLELRDKVVSLENCPTCLQKVGRDHKCRIEKQTQYEIEEISRELVEEIQRRQILVGEIETHKKLIRDYESDMSTLQQDRIKFEHQKTIETKMKSDAFVLDRISNETLEMESRLEELRAKIQSFSETQEKFVVAKKEFLDINDRARTREIKIATSTKELEILKIKLQELSEEIQSKEKIREEASYLQGLHRWIQDKFLTMINITEKNVLAKLRTEFSNIFFEWFSTLVSDSLSVRLDEDFTPIITNQDYEIDYEFLSGGERTATALAYRLALNQVLNSIFSQIETKNILILDEPTDGFSTEQIDKMRDIFEQLKAEQIILVSHEQKIEGFVDHVIKVKKDGASMVENSEVGGFLGSSAEREQY